MSPIAMSDRVKPGPGAMETALSGFSSGQTGFEFETCTKKTEANMELLNGYFSPSRCRIDVNKLTR
jgi:hypothetical protein